MSAAKVAGRVVAAQFSDGLVPVWAHGTPCGLEGCECPEHEWDAENPTPAGTYITIKLDHDSPVTLGQRLLLTPEVTR